MRSKIKKDINLFVVFGLEIAMIVVFHSLFYFLKLNFSSNQNTIQFISAILVAMAIFLSWWVFLSSLVYLTISLISPSTIRSMQGKKFLSSLSFPSVRRIIDATIVATIIGSSTIAAPLISHASQAQTVYLQEQTETADPFAPADTTTTTDDTTSTTSDETTTTTPTTPTDSVESEDPFSSGTTATTSAPTTTTIPVEETAPTTAPSGSLTDLINGGVKTEGGKTDSGKTTTTTTPTTTPSANNDDPFGETTTTTTPKISTQVEGKTETNPVVPSTSTETPAPTEAAPTSSQYTVVSGDNFWDIASKQLSNKLGRAANNQEITNYWMQLVEANKGNIKSGNPNLIFPGEVINLP